MPRGQSDCIQESDYGVAVGFLELAEAPDAVAGVALRRIPVPHYGLHGGACAAVVQAVGRRGAGYLLMQSAAPERSGAAPPGADIVGHVEFVLHHVGIGPNRLIGIAREFVAGEEAGRIAHMVGTGLPRGAVAVSASYFLENLFPACHLGVVDIAYGRNGQSTVPYHEVGILIVGHLDIQILELR